MKILKDPLLKGGPSTCREVLWVLNERLLRGGVRLCGGYLLRNIVEDGHEIVGRETLKGWNVGSEQLARCQ